MLYLTYGSSQSYKGRKLLSRRFMSYSLLTFVRSSQVFARGVWTHGHVFSHGPLHHGTRLGERWRIQVLQKGKSQGLTDPIKTFFFVCERHS